MIPSSLDDLSPFEAAIDGSAIRMAVRKVLPFSLLRAFRL